MMDPEASVSALVFQHPDCAYFSAGDADAGLIGILRGTEWMERRRPFEEKAASSRRTPTQNEPRRHNHLRHFCVAFPRDFHV